jgi:hypothetical protein
MMPRQNYTAVRLSDAELLLIEHGAELSNPTLGGANLARFTRSAALATSVEAIVKPILQSRSLEALRDALNAYGALLHELERTDDGQDLATDLHVRGGRFMPELPTFGGEMPDNTDGIWSWDAGRVLVGEGWSFQLEERPAAERSLSVEEWHEAFEGWAGGTWLPAWDGSDMEALAFDLVASYISSTNLDGIDLDLEVMREAMLGHLSSLQ